MAIPIGAWSLDPGLRSLITNMRSKVGDRWGKHKIFETSLWEAILQGWSLNKTSEQNRQCVVRAGDLWEEPVGNNLRAGIGGQNLWAVVGDPWPAIRDRNPRGDSVADNLWSKPVVGTSGVQSLK